MTVEMTWAEYLKRKSEGTAPKPHPKVEKKAEKKRKKKDDDE